jgi:hypothetical protein
MENFTVHFVKVNSIQSHSALDRILIMFWIIYLKNQVSNKNTPKQLKMISRNQNKTPRKNFLNWLSDWIFSFD